MADKLKYAIGNSSSTTLSGSVANDGTTMTITSDTNFAAKEGEGMIIVDEGTATEEFAYSTGKTGTTLTTPLANRGLEGGEAKAHDANATVKGIITATMWNDVIDSLVNVVDKTTGAVKPLTNKTFYGANFNPPEGFLLNGKIVPSVADNNLTVALKGLDGNDPSATNPIYVRIGDTVHSITSALSVTKNAGTKWFNAGSAELATKEVDYFVYLGYNATDGVVIGFSRIPYATQYDQFSATTTNEKYCAISTISNAAATDYYTVVGRFAATLSAGAGYTWTVPTFTAINLIQRPIFETRSLVWVPGNLSGATVPTSTTNTGTYKVLGSEVEVYGAWLGTPNGNNFVSAITTTLPFLSYDLYVNALRGGWSMTDNNTFNDQIMIFQETSNMVKTSLNLPVTTRKPNELRLTVQYRMLV
jgi:hypothetical protein